MSGPRILVAGVGNIFRGDDAFGVEVARRLAVRRPPDGVRVTDFGIRGHDLAYAILDGYDGVIVVDATTRDGPPGTLYTIELSPGAWARLPVNGTHAVDLQGAFDVVRAMGGTLPPVYLLGCEPAELGPDDSGVMGLSKPVAAAVEEAVAAVESLIEQMRAGAGRA